MSRGTIATINFANLRHNFQVLKQLAPNKLVLVVKADAYGHGLKQVVQALKNVDCFAVATIDEALLIRQYRPTVKVLLLEGFFNAQELHTSLENNFDCVVHQQFQLDLIAQLQSNKKINIWLKYDSGMNRLGFDDAAFCQAIKQLEQDKHLKQLILMSHFASANDPNSSFTATQKQKFLEIQNKYHGKYQLSLSNSSALLNRQHLNDEWCRVGLSLFGVSPVEQKQAANYNLLPVMTLQTNIIAVKEVRAQATIGYSQKFTTEKTTKIAIIGIGYGDGYPWSLSSNAYVKIKQQKAKILGRVSMDMMAVDISMIKNVQCGDAVLIWGDDGKDKLPVEIVAENAKTIAYVLLCQITSRVHFNYV